MVEISKLYFYLSVLDVAYKFKSLQTSIPSLQRSGVSFLLIAVAHWAVMARILFYSLRHKQLAFCSPVQKRRSSRSEAEPQSPSQFMAVRVLYSLWRRIRRIWSASFGRNGYFGLNGSLFDSGFEAREVIEIVIQTFQAHNLSWSIPKRWINSLVAVSIVLNCCATSLAYAIFRGESQPLVRRLFCRVADMLLDSCCSLVIPLCIFYPYWRSYDQATRDFQAGEYFDEVWYVNAIAEGRYILITSVPDYISTLVPRASILSCLVTIESLLQQKRTVLVSQPTIDLAQVTAPEQRIAWFTTNYSCSVMEVNCYRQQVSGESGQINSVRKDLDRLVLRLLAISHCSAADSAGDSGVSLTWRD